MRHLRIDVGPEAILRRLDRFPQSFRLLGDEREAHDGFDRLEAVLPRHRKTQRRTHLLGDRLAISAGDEEREFIGRLRHRQPFHIGPRIQRTTLSRCHLRIVEGFHLKIFRAGCRLTEFHELRERESRPRDRHAPRLDAAMTIKPLLERHLFQKIVDGNLLRLLDHAIDGDHPGADAQLLRFARQRFRRREFVEVIVVEVDLLRRHVAVEDVFRIVLGWIKTFARIGDIGNALRHRT